MKTMQVQWMRRIARWLGIFLVVLTVLYLLGEGPVTLEEMSPIEILQTAALLSMLVGTLIAWRSEGTGGVIMLISGLVFVGLNSVDSGYLRVGLIPALYLMAGTLFVAVFLQSDRPQ